MYQIKPELSPSVLQPCPKEIKARWNISEWSPTLAHSSLGDGGKSNAPWSLEVGEGHTETHTHAQVRIPICWCSHTGTNSQWIGAVNSVATLLSHSTPIFTYLLAAMAVMTGPLTLRKPPRLHNVPSSSSVKILRAPGLVWWIWRELACSRVVGCIQGANCSNAFTRLPCVCVCVSQSEAKCHLII